MGKGQSLVEFGIILPIILILLAGAVELGIGLFQYIQLRDAAQEGALFGSICQRTDLIELRARNSSSSPLDLNSPEVVVQTSFDGTGDVGDGVRVSLSYEHKVFMPFGEVLFGKYVHIEGHVTDTILERDVECKR